jgi:hypothetical protein
MRSKWIQELQVTLNWFGPVMKEDDIAKGW